MKCSNCGGKVFALYYRRYRGEQQNMKYVATAFSLCSVCEKLFTTVEYRPITKATRA